MVTEKSLAHFHGCQIATTSSVKQHKLKKLVALLSSKEGNGKEFISLYIPRDKIADEVIAFLKEASESADIEPDNLREVRNRLQNAIKNIIQFLKLQKEIPENGLAIFAGSFARNDSKPRF